MPWRIHESETDLCFPSVMYECARLWIISHTPVHMCLSPPPHHSSSNGVKEMDGFREYFNLSARYEVNSTTSCTAGDSSEETSAVLVE